MQMFPSVVKEDLVQLKVSKHALATKASQGLQGQSPNTPQPVRPGYGLPNRSCLNHCGPSSNTIVLPSTGHRAARPVTE
ncbi:hypothetical protein Taro_035218 [Colocasia esculenta]|uniref:Uncharacterized protein n=1 Tax=Colocasia esculenta TaxID=4460 RepID=A0A843VYF2_COLES|nr:hypothetical protein [Colocasia esculenta]